MAGSGSGPADGGTSGAPAAGPGVPLPVLRSWDQAEARLFPLIMARPEVYQQAISMISQLAARLRETCPDLTALIAAHERGGDLVASQAAQRRLAALAQAREQGLSWVVVEESGSADRAPYVPYQRIEAEVSSGR